ncbi:unnamed protein product [Adineta ricciae]|uniref:Uncharacterized protein n=1 Tax=Adineta ricciae TaxID=249248 RepID=A0A815X4A7_ADIRI|nr:unnamed protein product [Adineta ricciae]CAF1553204.1 unnamed protein product [Adineta ricciae]
MFIAEMVSLWIFLFIIKKTSGIVSYNQPRIDSNSSWNPNGMTILSNISYLNDIFIDINNTIFIPNYDDKQILLIDQQNFSSTLNLSLSLFNSSTIFVRSIDEIYIDAYYTIGGITEIKSNLTIEQISRMILCQQCLDLFVTENNILYCSFNQHHEILSQSLTNDWSPLMTVAGTGSEGSTSTTLRFPYGIFIDENTNQDLFVADCGNNRIQLFPFEKLTATTIVGSGSMNITIDLNCPTGIILDFDKYLFIVDSFNHRIIGENQYGFKCLVGCSNSSGSASNQLYYPWSVNFDSYGNLFVSDRKNQRIQKFELIIYSRVWINIASMNVPRNEHIASLLVNGKVLVSSGQNSGGYINSAELYDSSADNWTMTGNMSTGRGGYTASVLFNGKVLVSGGYNGGILKSAELYDPTTNHWTLTGYMNNGRYGHTSSVLLNGTILVTGGNNAMTNVELYDPSTGSWTSTGNMNVARTRHGALVLSNGKVLVTGGSSNKAAELYDPATGICTITGSMNVVRSFFTMSKLSNGKILVAGGDNNNVGVTAELYDPLTGNWTMIGNMSVARQYHTASILSNGKVLISGGSSSSTTTEVYDPLTDSWIIGANMNVVRKSPASVVLSNGKVLVTAGSPSLSSAELY